MQGPQQVHAALYQLLLQQRALPAAPSGQPSQQQHGHDAALLSMMQHVHMRAQLQVHPQPSQQQQAAQPQRHQARPAQATSATLPAGTLQQAATALGPQQARLPQAAAAALAAGTQQHTTQEANEGLHAGVPLAAARGRLPLQPCGSWASGNTCSMEPIGMYTAGAGCGQASQARNPFSNHLPGIHAETSAVQSLLGM